jgi:hypothetical protein
MLELRNRMVIAVTLCPWSLFLSGVSDQESVRSQKPWEGIHLEFAVGELSSKILCVEVRKRWRWW